MVLLLELLKLLLQRLQLPIRLLVDFFNRRISLNLLFHLLSLLIQDRHHLTHLNLHFLILRYLLRDLSFQLTDFLSQIFNLCR